MIVQIQKDYSEAVEYLYDNTEALRQIMNDLENINIKDKYINQLFQNYEIYKTELERLKQEISEYYCPKEHKNRRYKYTFNFNNNELIYEDE